MQRNGFGVTIQGLDELAQKFGMLARGSQVQTVVRGAVNAAARPAIKEARKRVPRRYGILRKSLGAKIRVYRRSGVIVGVVGARGGFKTQDPVTGKNIDPRYYAHLIELGTYRVAPIPFLRPAAEASRKESDQQFFLTTEKKLTAILTKKTQARTKKVGG